MIKKILNIFKEWILSLVTWVQILSFIFFFVYINATVNDIEVAFYNFSLIFWFFLFFSLLVFLQAKVISYITKGILVDIKAMTEKIRENIND